LAPVAPFVRHLSGEPARARHRVRQLDRRQGAPHLLVGVRLQRVQVQADAAAKQRRVLRNQSDRAAQALPRDACGIDAVDCYLAVDAVRQPEHCHCEGGFPCRKQRQKPETRNQKSERERETR